MTDWNLIRDMMAAAIDTCERVEAAGYDEDDRDAVANVGGVDVSIQDFLTSAWTYPENIRYAIIRERHDQADDRAYVPEASRILIAMAQAAAEIIGSHQPKAPAEDDIRKMVTWFDRHAVPGIEKAIANRRRSSS